jgi:hypothetical protein
MRRLRVFGWTFFGSILLCAIMSVGGQSNTPDGPQSMTVPPPAQVQPIPPQRFKYQVREVRLLILKHSREQMADDDANLAVRAAQKAAQAGLPIKVVGNEFTTNMDQVRAAVNKYIKQDAVKGDTLVIHTIGHGHQGGTLAGLGQRSGVFNFLSTAAFENKQNVLWWQLSCYACAGLPKIDSLPPEQQEYFEMYASSSATEPSGTRTQAWIMGKVFDALAINADTIDPDHDSTVKAQELKDFINSLNSGQWGSRLFSKNPDHPIFGRMEWLDVMLFAGPKKK